MKNRLKLFTIFVYILAAALGPVTVSMFGSQVYAAADPASISYLKSHAQDAWTIMTLASLGQTPDSSSLNNLPTSSALEYEKTIMAMVAAGQNPQNWAGRDLIREFLDKYYTGGQIGSADYLNDDFWGILALSAARSAGAADSRLASAIEGSRAKILAGQNSDGGWSYAAGPASDSNDTAAALMALVETGSVVSDPAVQRAVSYLHSLQKWDGGMAFSREYESDAASDGWVIAALNKLRLDAGSWQQNGLNPRDHLASLRQADGSYQWQKGQAANSQITSSAVLSLEGGSYPVRPPTTVSKPSPVSPAAPVEPMPAPQPRPEPSLPTRPYDSNSADRDADGLTDAAENNYHTDPDNFDTDGDGFRDGAEIKAGYDPINPAPCVKPVGRGNGPRSYGQRRLAAPRFEKCFANYLAARLKGVKMIKPWTKLVDAFIYGGYRHEEIKAWAVGGVEISESVPKWPR